MPSAILWNEKPTAETLIATDGALKNLASGSLAVSAACENGTGLKRWADFELYLHDFAAAPTAGGYFELHIFYELDGSNYADQRLSANTYAGSFQVYAGDEAQRLQLTGVPIGPHDFKCAIANYCGQAVANTDGSFLKIYRYSEEQQ